MEQMKAPMDIPILASLEYGRITSGFARIRGNVFYLAEHGHTTIRFPVLTDGTILRTGDVECPDKVVDLIDLRDLGISKVRWESADPGTPLTPS